MNKKIEKALNDQVAMEGNASNYYLAMAAWCAQNGFEGTAKFFHSQSEEEREHMMKIFHYIIDAGGRAEVPAIEKPQSNFKSLPSTFDIALKNEVKVTKSIHKMLDLSNEQKDHRTSNFLQWFVTEQMEEENQFQTILDKLKIIGDDGRSLYMLDKELRKKAVAKE
jgi:ferritin